MPRDREAILAEMGLTPLWKLRRKPASVAEAPPAEPQSAPEPQSRSESQSQSQSLASAQPREALIRVMEWGAVQQAVHECRACSLHASRTQAVFGVGDERADWLVIGEAPGAEEDRQGEPFVGQAGKLLDRMLAALGLRRGDNVYIANVLKCRPPGNRNPDPEEVERCAPYLARQIELIRPKIILGLGRFAAQTLLHSDASIASLRGRVHRYAGVPLVVTYHPAYLLRNLPDKAKVWADLVLAKRVMRGQAQ